MRGLLRGRLATGAVGGARLGFSVATALVVALAVGCDGRDAGESNVPEGASRPPNIVMIISDDQGYRDFGFMGSEHVQTPTLDALAAEGTVFTQAYLTATICGPSLQSLLTGLHPFEFKFRVIELARQGVERDHQTELQDFTTLPRRLAEHGYASFQGGKIVEDHFEVAGFTEGVDQARAASGGWRAGGEIGRSTMEPVFDFVDRHLEQPFFLWFAPMLPHLPFDAPERFRKPFRERGYVPGAVGYYANIARFDDAVAELIAHLDARGLRENTLIVLLADNGWDQEAFASFDGPLGLGGPRGKKSMYELGFRTPVVLSWPGRIPAGVVHEELISSVDLFPTILDYAGAAPMAGREGRSLRPLIEEEVPWSRDLVIGSMVQPRPNASRPAERGPPSMLRPEFAFFVRSPRWHYIWYEDWGAEALFDLEQDPEELRDVAAQHPKLTAAFRQRIQAWQRELQKRALADPTN